MVGIFKQDWGQTSKVEFRKPIRGGNLEVTYEKGLSSKK